MQVQQKFHGLISSDPRTNVLQVLQVQLRVHGHEHPLTLVSMNNLAQTLGQLGNHRQAESMQKQVR